MGDVGHRQDDARDAGLQGGDRARRTRSRSTRCRACWPRSATPTTRDAGERSYMDFFDRARGGRPAAPRRPRRREATDWVLEQLYSLVNERYEQQRSILVTTNLIETADAGGADRRSAPSRASTRCAATRSAVRRTDLRERLRPRDALARSAEPARRLLDSLRYARTSRRGRPVGRRRKGKGHRPARRAGRPRDPLSGRQQRRPHDRPRRTRSSSST